MKKLLTVLLASSMLTGWAFAEEAKKTKDDPYVLMELFGDVFAVIKSDYVEEVSDRKLIESAVDGMLTSLDPHSGFMDNEAFSDMQTQTKGEFGGLGLEVSMDKGFVRVVSPIDDTPAFKAGLQTGDYITHIDGVSVSGLSLHEAVKKMRGEPKTKVQLTISRGMEKPFDITLVRDIIKVQPVKFKAYDDVGYIRIISFSETAGAQTKKAIESLTGQIGPKKLKGFVLDLRNNPGGLLDQAVEVADLFLDKGEIVSTRSRKPEETMRYSAKAGDMAKGRPIVVLINEGSASASEIVSGALQDHKRAVIAGLKSFGKGSVQTVRPIPGFGGIRITTARYYTPSGTSIQASGIVPDIEIPRAKIEKMPIITGFGEEDLPKAIAAEEGKKAQDIKPKKGPVIAEETTEDETADYQLDRSLELVRGMALYSVFQDEEKNAKK